MIDLKNQRFGFWIVESLSGKNNNGQTMWLCKCDCGTRKNVTSNSLRTGNSTSCGCNHKPNLIGEKFGKLTVLSIDNKKNKGRRYWLCKCECENIISINTHQLRNNIIVSCGCDNKLIKNKINNFNENINNNCLVRLEIPYNELTNLILSARSSLFRLNDKIKKE